MPKPPTAPPKLTAAILESEIARLEREVKGCGACRKPTPEVLAVLNAALRKKPHVKYTKLSRVLQAGGLTISEFTLSKHVQGGHAEEGYGASEKPRRR